MKKLIPLIVFVSTISFSCNLHSANSLVGQKLYFLYKKEISIWGIKSPLYIEELEFNFNTKDEVMIAPTAYYGNGDALEANKQVKANYTFTNGYLTVLNLNLPATKLTESDGFYSTDAGEIYYKESIIRLSQDEKRDRLQKTLLSSMVDKEKIDSDFLLKETIFHNQ